MVTNVGSAPTTQYLSLLQGCVRWDARVAECNNRLIEYVGYDGQITGSISLEIPENLQKLAEISSRGVSTDTASYPYLSKRTSPFSGVPSMLHVITDDPLFRT